MKSLNAVLVATTSLILSSTIAATADNPLPKSTDNLVKYGEVEGWTVYDKYKAMAMARECFKK